MHLEVCNTMLHFCYKEKLDDKTLDIMGKNGYNNKYGLMSKVWHYNQQPHIIIYFKHQIIRILHSRWLDYI